MGEAMAAQQRPNPMIPLFRKLADPFGVVVKIPTWQL
jgi:hypothetical protein